MAAAALRARLQTMLGVMSEGRGFDHALRGLRVVDADEHSAKFELLVSEDLQVGLRHSVAGEENNMSSVMSMNVTVI
jgi:hypothetical protein